MPVLMLLKKIYIWFIIGSRPTFLSSLMGFWPTFNKRATDRRQWRILMAGYILQWMDKA